MVSLLLPVIYLAFISLGLPDALLGAAWPSMYPRLGRGRRPGRAGVSMIISAGTSRVQPGQRAASPPGSAPARVTAHERGHDGRGAVRLFHLHGSSGSCVCGPCPYGLGAGSVDAALNNYVALHYESRHMSWLHCMWGLGAGGRAGHHGLGAGGQRLAERLPHHL